MIITNNIYNIYYITYRKYVCNKNYHFLIGRISIKKVFQLYTKTFPYSIIYIYIYIYMLFI